MFVQSGHVCTWLLQYEVRLELALLLLLLLLAAFTDAYSMEYALDVQSKTSFYMADRARLASRIGAPAGMKDN